MATADIPPWLNEDFVKLALDDEGKGIEIRNMDVVRPIPKGNNYATVIYRTDVDYESKQGTKELSLIVKVPHEASQNEIIASLGIYSKEFLIYKQLIPKMNKVLNGTGIAPKVYKSSRGEVIVMEDLKKNGYLMADRKKQLDFEHAALVFTLLAKFHAGSLKILEEDPDLIQEVGKECLLNMDQTWGNDFVSSFSELLAKEVENWPESKKYAKSIRKNSECLFEKTCELMTAKSDDFLVLNHGDLWTTNMLFKYEESKPVSVKFLDFQVCRYNNPVYDIIYFTAGSLQDGARTEKLDDLLNIYLDVLNSELERHGIDKNVTFPELKKWMDDRQIFAYYTAIMSIPFFIADESDVVDIADQKSQDFFSKDNNPFEGTFKSKTLRRILPKRLAELEKIGFLVPDEDNQH